MKKELTSLQKIGLSIKHRIEFLNTSINNIARKSGKQPSVLTKIVKGKEEAGYTVKMLLMYCDLLDLKVKIVPKEDKYNKTFLLFLKTFEFNFENKSSQLSRAKEYLKEFQIPHNFVEDKKNNKVILTFI